MKAIRIGVIIIGILITIIALIGALFGIAMIFADSVLGMLFGIIVTVAMVIIIISLWGLIQVII